MKNILFVLWLEKLKLVQLVCVTSQFIKWNIHKHLPTAAFNYEDLKISRLAPLEVYLIWKSSTCFFIKFFHILWIVFFGKAMGRCFLLVISNGSWPYYFVLLDMLVVSPCTNYVLLAKDIHPKYFNFYRPGSWFNIQMPLKNSKFFGRCSLMRIKDDLIG